MEPNKSSDPTPIMFTVAMVIAVVMFAGGVLLFARGHGAALFAGGAVAVVGVLITWPLAMLLTAQSRAARSQSYEAMRPLIDRLEQLSTTLTTMSERQLLSDRAKSVAYRQKDREAIRRAITEDVGRGDFDAAFVLADDIERVYGYKQDADTLRAQITEARQGAIAQQLGEAMKTLDGHVQAEQWTAAQGEVEALQRRFPDVDRIQLLANEVDVRKQAMKKKLLDNWNDANARHDVDGSIATLKKLDSYLTPDEAERLQESVRGVFKEKINQLRTQFALAVKDQNWPEAMKIGEVIVRDFPNSKIADEVKGSMEGLRARIAEPAAV